MTKTSGCASKLAPPFVARGLTGGRVPAGGELLDFLGPFGNVGA